jgi:two-component system chemotaxis sensor kinase CheA
MSDLHKLQKLIESYEEGDLLAAAELRETAEELSRDSDEAAVSGLLEEIMVTAEQIVLEGATAENSLLIKDLGKRLIQHTEEEKGEQSESEGASDLQEVPIEDIEILSSFILEAHDHLDDIEERILDLEKDFDEQTVHDIFRSMHTIKGVSSFIGLHKIKRLSHHLETILNSLRSGEIEMEDQVIDVLLSGADTLQKMIHDIEVQAAKIQEGGGVSKLYEGRIDTGTVDKLMAPYLERIEGGDAAKRPQASKVTDSGREMKTAETSGAGPGVMEDLISPEMILKFVEETTDLVDTAEHAMLELEKEPENTGSIKEAFRAIHTIKGNAGFFGFAMLEQMCMGIEGILDTLRSGARKPDDQVINLLLKSIDGLNTTLHKIQSGEILPGDQADTSVTAEEALAGKEQGDFKPLGDMLVEMGIATREAVDQALDLQRMRLGEILVTQGAAKEEEINKVLEKQGKTQAEKGDQFAGYRMKRRDIRVDTERLDKLFDLMGELITAEAMVINNPDLEEKELPNFEHSANYLSKITREMQEITMAIRMIPLEGLFSKMRRLIRDLSKKFDKPIDMVISGEDTEMDRNVMEEISDPLVHIIRNAVDHGIEDAEKRRERGKPATGTVQLAAGYEGNEIWITISDDGEGLNRKKILQRSVERGLIQGDPEELKDEEVWKMIFEPGFSTAEQVSEISGRGVGMDVVRQNIQKLRGKIDIRSVEGEGSTFVLRIPLTLAIIDAINFTVGTQMYSIPITDVLQFHKASEGELTNTSKDDTVINIRSEVIPLIKLHDFYHIETNKREAGEGIVIVVQARDRKAALLADEIIGYRQIVIKSLPPYMEDIRALSGCSIMSDGKVSMIIDTGSLISYVLE